MSRSRTVVINSLTNYGRFAVSLGVFFFLTPYMIDTLGVEDYGLWSLVFSVVGFFGLLDLGFGTGVVKYVAEAKGQGDVERRNRMLSTLLLVYLVLALIAAAGLGVLSLAFRSIFDLDADQASRALVLLWIIGCRAVIFNLPLSLWRGALFGEQRIHVINGVQAAATLVYGLAAWWLLGSGLGLIPLAWLNLAAMLVEHGLYILIARRQVPELKVSPRLARRSEFREAFSFSVFAFIVSVAALVLMRTDPIIVKFFLPLTAVAAYAVALRIAENGLLLTKQFVNVLTPLVAELKGGGEDDKVRFVLVNATRFAIVPAAGLAVGAAVLGREALEFWIGPEMVSAWPVLVILMTAMTLSVPQMVASSVLTMTGHHRFTASAAALSVAINVGVSLALVRSLGLVGVALGTLTATAIVDVGLVLSRACKVHGLSLAGYLLKIAPAVVVPAAAQWALTWGLKAWLPPRGLGAVVLLAVPGGLLYLALFWLVFVEKSEKELIVGKVFKRAG